MQWGIARRRRHQTGNLYGKDAAAAAADSSSKQTAASRRDGVGIHHIWTQQQVTTAGVLNPSADHRTFEAKPKINL